MKHWDELDARDLADLFGADEDDIKAKCGDLIVPETLRYHRLDQENRDRLILEILQRLESDSLKSAGEARREDWEKGWGQNLNEFRDAPEDTSRLIPKYYKKNVPVRMGGDYVQPDSENFVHTVTHIFRSWLFQTYLSNVDAIYEFGCGTGHHLAYLADLYPGCRLVGLDWATSSQAILKELRERMGWNIRGINFDFFRPDTSLDIPENSGVYTFGALEQVADRHGAFLDLLLEKKPAICINVEGLHELYDSSRLSDHLACRYHMRRNYLNGYLSRLRELASQGYVEILALHHQRFGNLFDDPHSYIVWRPVPAT